MTQSPPSPFSKPEPWELVAAGYEATTMGFLSGYAKEALASVNLHSGSRVVDVACGPGTVTRMLAGQVGSIDAIDFSAPMIDLLNRYLKNQNINNVKTHLGDGQQLPYADQQFDLGISMFGLMFFPDRLKGFSELKRVLKPGGRVIVSSWAPVSDSPMMHLMFGAIRAANPSMPEPKANSFNLENSKLFEEEMTQAGFKNVTVKRCTQSVQATDVVSFWEFMTIGSAPIVMMRKNAGEEKWQQMEAASLAYLHQEMKDLSRPYSSDAWVGMGDA